MLDVFNKKGVTPIADGGQRRSRTAPDVSLA